MGIKVRVKSGMPDGFFGFHTPKGKAGVRHYKDPIKGTREFSIDHAGHFSDRWMECLDDGYDVVGGKLVEKRKGSGRPAKSVESE